MNKKRLILLSTLLMITFGIYGCGNIHTPAARSTESFFRGLEKYKADVTVTFLKDKQPNVIKMNQAAKMSGEYEMTVIEPEHLKGVKIAYDGHQITETFPGVNEVVTGKESAAQNEILFTTFVKRYLTNENIKEQKLQLNGKNVITYEMPIEGDFKYLSTEKLWLDVEKQQPMQLIIYDDENQVTIEVIYEDFKFNA